MRRLKFLENSPAGSFAKLYTVARRHNWTRSAVLAELEWLDRREQTKVLQPGSFWNDHRRWLDSLEGYHPLTYEFRESEASHRVRAVAEREDALLHEWVARVGREVGAAGEQRIKFIEAAAQALWTAEEAGVDLSTVTVEAVEAEMRKLPPTAEIGQVAYRTREAAQDGLASPQPAAKVIRFSQAADRPASPPPPPISA